MVVEVGLCIVEVVVAAVVVVVGGGVAVPVEVHCCTWVVDIETFETRHGTVVAVFAVVAVVVVDAVVAVDAVDADDVADAVVVVENDCCTTTTTTTTNVFYLSKPYCLPVLVHCNHGKYPHHHTPYCIHCSSNHTTHIPNAQFLFFRQLLCCFEKTPRTWTTKRTWTTWTTTWTTTSTSTWMLLRFSKKTRKRWLYSWPPQQQQRPCWPFCLTTFVFVFFRGVLLKRLVAFQNYWHHQYCWTTTFLVLVPTIFLATVFFFFLFFFLGGPIFLIFSRLFSHVSFGLLPGL